MNRLFVPACAVLSVLVLLGCGGGGEGSSSAPSSTRNGAPPSTGDGNGGVRLERIGDFDRPLYVTQPPGDRRDLYVVEQPGRIRVVRQGRILDQPFLDLSSKVSCCGEQGLLSMAFAPDYGSSGRFYVDYTDRAGDTRVVEYRSSDQRSGHDSPPVADPSSARRVLGVHQPFTNHNGGLILFGPDRSLYVGLGDGGSEGDPNRTGQDLSTLLGKILRIDPCPAAGASGRCAGGRAYSVPRSNPFVGKAGARPEIYSYGLRNPWRFSFDPANGDLAIGDVGQNRFEEVDLVGPGEGNGENFGWSAFEGFTSFNDDQKAPDAVPPVLVYSHDEGCSITGGYVVRDRSLPSLYGRYLYGDYCSGVLRSFPAVPDQRAADDRSLGLQVPSLSSFGTDDAGHVYATSLEGPVFQLVRSR